MRAAFASLILGSARILTVGGIRAVQGGQAKPSPRDDPEQQRKVLSQFMGKKLQHTQGLIAALAVEDFVGLADDARALKEIGRDSLWKVSHTLKYVKYGAEFTSIAEELERRALEKGLNGATLSYVGLTINCVECHRYLGDERILDPKFHGSDRVAPGFPRPGGGTGSQTRVGLRGGRALP
jgi:hypothetical protein